MQLRAGQQPSQSVSGAGGVQVPIGVAALSRLQFGGGGLDVARRYLAERATGSPNAAACLLDLATVELIMGRPAVAQALQIAALSECRLFRRPSAYGMGGPHVLAIMAPGDLMANTPLEFLLEDSDITLDMLFCTPLDALPDPLPEHDLIFVAVAESDAAAPLLASLSRQLAGHRSPVLNPPDRIAGLSRTAVAATLRGLPGVVAPPAARVARAAFAQAAEDDRLGDLVQPGAGRIAIIARPIGSHAGQGLARLETAAAARDYLDRQDGEDFYVARFVDYSGPDGRFRKYRVAFVEGVAHAGHMAISDHWMVHYLNAGMWDDQAKRDEEARWMAEFDTAFAPRHAAAFAALHAALGLDYFVIDCAETADGALLVFEADPAMLVHAMDAPALFAYKQAPMRRIFSAVQAMIRRRAGG